MTTTRLGVPYYEGSDGRGLSAVCAMAAEHLFPGCLIASSNRQDHYIKVVRSHGSLGRIDAHITALQQLQIKAAQQRANNLGALLSSLSAGIPVPVQWYYQGPAHAPSEPRWTLLVGYHGASRELIFHDPMGRGDLDRGGMISAAAGDGAFVRYKRGRFLSRWKWDGLKASAGLYLDLARSN